MKTQKGLAVLATVSLLGLSVACNDRYNEGVAAGKNQGYRQGYDVGYDDGYADGDEAGYERARQYFQTADYTAGFNAGKTAGVQIGYNQGFSAGRSEGITVGRNEGYNLGYDDGYDDGLVDGYDIGYDDGLVDGYDMGYDDGFVGGYDVGYDDGWYDAGGLSVGKTKGLKGYSNLLSMVHNDLFDYSKIKAPKQTARGVLVNGNMLFEDTSLTGKDTLKRKAVIEQYLVVEMAKQVQSKFGLSAERSLKVAKAGNHFRKQASRRALTADDTNAYVEEIMGADLKAFESAFDRSLRGDTSGLKDVINAAAQKNETTPEKMSEIVTSLFL